MAMRPQKDGRPGVLVSSPGFAEFRSLLLAWLRFTPTDPLSFEPACFYWPDEAFSSQERQDGALETLFRAGYRAES